MKHTQALGIAVLTVLIGAGSTLLYTYSQDNRSDLKGAAVQMLALSPPTSTSSQGYYSSPRSSYGVSSPSPTPEPATMYSDLSVILDTDAHTVAAGSEVTYYLKVTNSGSDDLPGATVLLLKNDMTYQESSVFCYVQNSDTTYIRCTVPPLAAGASTTITVTAQLPTNFTCINSTGGRSAFAFVRAPSGGNIDLYPQNNTSNIVNILPVCGGTSSSSAPSSQVSCNEPDNENGDEEFVRGTSTLGSASNTDYCEDDEILVEYNCEFGFMEGRNLPCQFGCSDGACRRQQVAPACSTQMGDVNLDGNVTFLDYSIALNAFVRRIILDPDQFACADMDENGNIDYSDLQEIRKLF